ncbi:adenosylhomocysteinase [bacterium]|nr:adenosylhomocysteinase [bacterium]MBU1065799.1 adenosylhomocysteinase [bacterium]MBU1635785.1 adenosylhomocysteinase [bacterium]MBU1873393.1 adenosylhomocysteinase [bacterium]
MEGKIKDIKMADAGRLKIEWAEAHMPVMMTLREKFAKTKPLAGMRISGCLHVTKETAVLIRTLIAAGARVAWSGCNPLSTQDDVAAALYAEGVPIWAWHGLSTKEFYWCIDQTLIQEPTLTLDDGADLIFTVHNKYQSMAAKIIGGSEETTTGIHRLRAMAADGKLLYPVVAVNDAETKWDFDNIYGTGQSSMDGILRATSVLIAGKTMVVAGYGHCGKGCAMRADGQGANVICTEIKPTAALKATLDGYRVMPMDECAAIGDIFITATGMKDVIVKRHFEMMKDGAIVCNTGHYDCEINLKDLESITVSKKEIRPNCVQYTMKNGKRIYILGEGRLVNLVAAEGHPSEVMDMSFANQFMAMKFLAENKSDLVNKVYDISKEQDQEIAALKLKTMNIGIDKLTEEQIRYQTDYSEGT